MSQSSIVKSKSSPCCIGCVVIGVIAIGIVAALSIWGYRFFKENIGIHNVAALADPPLDVSPGAMFPEAVGDFTRVALNEEAPQIPGLENIDTTSIITARYADPAEHLLHTVAIPTDEAQNLRRQQAGPLTMGRGKANAPEVAISIKNPVDGNSTTLTWSKPNWTIMLYTTSTVAVKFLDAYKPPTGTEDGTGPAVEVESNGTTATATTAPETTEPASPAATEAPAVAPESNTDATTTAL